MKEKVVTKWWYIYHLSKNLCRNEANIFYWCFAFKI